MNEEFDKKTIVHKKSLDSQAKLLNPDGSRVFDWNVSLADMDLIRKVAKRFMDVMGSGRLQVNIHGYEAGELTMDEFNVSMDLCMIHLNITPMRLYAMTLCSETDLVQDIVQISLNLDRREGLFTHSFTPFFAERKN